MQSALEKRVELLRPLFPWDDPNYGLDECWARLYPYRRLAEPGQPFAVQAVVLNHSPREARFEIRPRLPKGWTLTGPSPAAARIPPGQEGAMNFSVLPPPGAPPGLYLLTADVRTEQGDFMEWTEALVRIRN